MSVHLCPHCGERIYAYVNLNKPKELRGYDEVKRSNESRGRGFKKLITQLLKEGIKPKEIAKVVGCSYEYVLQVRGLDIELEDGK